MKEKFPCRFYPGRVNATQKSPFWYAKKTTLFPATIYAKLKKNLTMVKRKAFIKSLFVLFTVAMSTVFAQHKSTAALAPEATVIINAVMFTAMRVVSTFVNV